METSQSNQTNSLAHLTPTQLRKLLPGVGSVRLLDRTIYDEDTITARQPEVPLSNFDAFSTRLAKRLNQIGNTAAGISAADAIISTHEPQSFAAQLVIL